MLDPGAAQNDQSDLRKNSELAHLWLQSLFIVQSRIPCLVCEQRFTRKIDCVEHYLAEHSDHCSVCPNCAMMLPSNELLLNHMETCNGPPAWLDFLIDYNQRYFCMALIDMGEGELPYRFEK